jgi:hypothetical protein
MEEVLISLKTNGEKMSAFSHSMMFMKTNKLARSLHYVDENKEESCCGVFEENANWHGQPAQIDRCPGSNIGNGQDRNRPAQIGYAAPGSAKGRAAIMDPELWTKRSSCASADYLVSLSSRCRFISKAGRSRMLEEKSRRALSAEAQGVGRKRNPSPWIF